MRINFDVVVDQSSNSREKGNRIGIVAILMSLSNAWGSQSWGVNEKMPWNDPLDVTEPVPKGRNRMKNSRVTPTESYVLSIRFFLAKLDGAMINKRFLFADCK